MWTKIIVLTILTITYARNVKYTDEDARRDISTIISHTFGLITNEPSEKQNPIQSYTHRNNDGIRSREITKNSKSDVFKESDMVLNRQINHSEKVVYQHLVKQTKTNSRVEQPQETFRDVNNKRITNTEAARTKSYVINSQVSDRNTNAKAYNRDSTVVNEIKPTPSLVHVKLKTQNAPRNKDVDTRKIAASEEKSRQATQIVKEVTRNRTEMFKEITTVRNKAAATIQTQIGTKKVDENKRTWSTEPGTTVITTSDLVDRAAFTGDKCPQPLVRFGNKCEEEDIDIMKKNNTSRV